MKVVYSFVSLIITSALMILNMALAQTHLTFSNFLINDGNAYNNRTNYQENIHQSSVQLNHQWTFSDIVFTPYYEINVMRYSKNSDLNNLSHNIGLRSRYISDKNTLSLILAARLFDYKDPFVYYEVNRYSGTLRYEYDPDLFQHLEMSLLIQKDHYNEFDLLDNTVFEWKTAYQHFFPNRLGVTVRGHLGKKNYVNQKVVQFYGYVPGRFYTARYREDPVETVQLSGSINVAKSLLSYTGMNVMLGGQWFIGDPIKAYLDGMYYFTQNDLYDDPYAYQGYFWAVQLTQQFGVGFQAKAGYKWMRKDYAGTPALDEVGELTGETRLDTRREFSFLLTKRWLTQWTWLSSLDLYLTYFYRENPSNDPYYDFKDNILMGGVAFTFKF